jgi:hypothetical protein
MAGSKERRPVTDSTNLELLFPKASAYAIMQCLAKAPRAPYSAFAFTLGEANIEHHNQFCADKGINPGKWATVRRARDWDSSTKLTRARHEAHVDCPGIAAVDVDGSAPIRTLSFDLETFCTDLGNGATRFYDGNDPLAKILCISAVTFNYTDKVIEGRVLALGDASAVAGGEEQLPTSDGTAHFTTTWFLEEKAMIRAFFALIRAYDPDIVTGWNTLGSAKAFDWMFLYKRCKTLDVALLDALKTTGRWGETKFFIDERAVERARARPHRHARTHHARHDAVDEEEQDASRVQPQLRGRELWLRRKGRRVIQPDRQPLAHAQRARQAGCLLRAGQPAGVQAHAVQEPGPDRQVGGAVRHHRVPH